MPPDIHQVLWRKRGIIASDTVVEILDAVAFSAGFPMLLGMDDVQNTTGRAQTCPRRRSTFQY
jgi:hypothetical protein